MNNKDDIKLKEDQQRNSQMEQSIGSHIKSAIVNLHTMLPGIIVSFDAATQTAQVQPAIKRIFTEKGAVNLPVCVDVPVEFPGGGGYFMTFPVKPGDECCLCFSERAIDFWHVNGGVQLPSEYRLHDLSDAIARVGLNSQPNKIANFFTGGAELRNRDADMFVRVADDGSITQQTGSGSTILTPDTFTVNAANIIFNGNVLTNGNLNITGTTIGNGVNLNTHVHTGVQPGGGNTGAPLA